MVAATWRLAGLLLAGLLLAAGCRAAPVVPAAVASSPTPMPRAPTATATAPTVTQAFSPGESPTPRPPATPTPQPIGAALDEGTPAPQATTPADKPNQPRRSPTATPTEVPPTFTPPPPPPPLADEHLLLARPVPASAPQWTDKSYPYGSTRGGRLRPHHGVEFNVPSGTPLLAVADGQVVVAGDDSTVAYGPTTDFYGNLVVLQLAGGSTPIYVLYGHLSEVSVAVGQTVATGEPLGLSGASGVADGPHLHLEVRIGDNSYLTTRNPLLWLEPLPGTGVVAGQVVSADGAPLAEAPVFLQRVDAEAPYTATTTYAMVGPNPTALGENFAVDDVVPGFYQVFVEHGDQRTTAELWVYADRVNWIEITIDAAN